MGNYSRSDNEDSLRWAKKIYTFFSGPRVLQTQIVQTEDALVDQSHTSENTKFIEKERKEVSNPRWLFSTTNVYSEY